MSSQGIAAPRRFSTERMPSRRQPRSSTRCRRTRSSSRPPRSQRSKRTSRRTASASEVSRRSQSANTTRSIRAAARLARSKRQPVRVTSCSDASESSAPVSRTWSIAVRRSAAFGARRLARSAPVSTQSRRCRSGSRAPASEPRTRLPSSVTWRSVDLPGPGQLDRLVGGLLLERRRVERLQRLGDPRFERRPQPVHYESSSRRRSRSSVSLASSLGCTTGTSRRALKPLALPSSVCVSSVPAPASRSA